MIKKHIAALWSGVVVGLLIIAMLATAWFKESYVGWLVESVADSNEFVTQWQLAISESDIIDHPAVIHYLPENCLCRVLTQKHAAEITVDAQDAGFSVYQINSNSLGLGNSIRIDSPKAQVLAPIIVITNISGQIAYVGAYSDGIRCNTGTSMVASFIESPQSLPTRPVVGLDVETCRCERRE